MYQNNKMETQMMKTFKHLSYRELQTFAKKLGLSAFGKRVKIIGRIRMYHYWKNQTKQVVQKFNYLQAGLVQCIYMVWIYLIMNPSKLHLIRPSLMLTN